MFTGLTTSSANPSLWYFDNARDDQWYLYYVDEDVSGLQELRVRRADDVTDLSDGDDRRLNISRMGFFGAASAVRAKGDFWALN